MNLVCLLGRVTKEIEVRYNNDLAVARFTLAVDRKAKDQPTDFINCVAFSKTAELIGKYVSKGQRLGVTGRIQTGSYTKNDGTKVYTTDVVAESVDFVEKKEATLKQPKPEQPKQQYQQSTMDGFYQPSFTEGLPFN